MKENEYLVSCIICGTKENLEMIAHRNNDKDYIVGWFFICPACLPKIAGQKATFQLEPEVKDDLPF